jgi:subtilisin family serine protease
VLSSLSAAAHALRFLNAFLAGMATPHVSGAAALYAAAYKRNTGSLPTYTNIKAAIMDSGVASSAYTVSCDKGLVQQLLIVPAGMHLAGTTQGLSLTLAAPLLQATAVSIQHNVA